MPGNNQCWKDMVRETPITVQENFIWFSLYEKQHGVSPKSRKSSHITQRFHFLAKALPKHVKIYLKKIS